MEFLKQLFKRDECTTFKVMTSGKVDYTITPDGGIKLDWESEKTQQALVTQLKLFKDFKVS